VAYYHCRRLGYISQYCPESSKHSLQEANLVMIIPGPA
jgi:hypothetical protein